ncbi:MAG: Na/Pi cotransporter family protein [Hungatella hathewayi]|nr:Na/Pi cotransporter family protein [Hungatella hathewayi]
MSIIGVFSLLGGLGLFLYGMQMMSGGLEAAAGNRMKQILEKLTANRFLGVIVGAGITAVIQSSSATTVMVVGFVNSGMMTLRQAVWIIMGANVGTTITGQLIALDVGAIAPLLAFIGVLMVVFIKKLKVQHYGQIVAGLGILFIGMGMMSDAMVPLRNSAAFVDLMTKFSNPLLGILAGAVFTAVIQSSSASVGILQALAVSGVIGLDNAVFVLFGQNIGTCITAVLAAVGTSRNAKRATVIHLIFNVFGTVLFTIICIAFPLTSFVEGLTPGNPPAQIANMHTLFNIATTVLLLPFGTKLAQLAERLLPERPGETSGVYTLEFMKQADYHGELSIGASAIAINSVRNELVRMADMARENVDMSFRSILERKPELAALVEEREEYVDYLNQEITKGISRMIVNETNDRDSELISALFKVTGNLERISDHAMNLAGYAKLMDKLHITLSKSASGEVEQMHRVSLEAMNTMSCIQDEPEELFRQIEELEQRIDDMTAMFRKSQIGRLREGKCNEEACVIYSEMLTDFERIGDHILNIGQEMKGCPSGV